MDKNRSPDQDTSLHLNKFAPNPATASEHDAGNSTIAIKRAAHQTMQEGGKVAMPKDAGELPPEEMLGAVSYCYAKGVYSSEEIEARMLRDPKLREALHDEVPRATAIRRFRMLNQHIIRATLEKAFRFLRKREPSVSASATTAQSPTSAGAQPVGEGTVTIVRRQASERLDEAKFVDNMSKE